MQIDGAGATSTHASVPTTSFDIVSEDVAVDPKPELRKLRAMGPIVWHEKHKRWLVTTDREIRKLVIDHRTYTVEETTVADLFGAEAFISMDNTQAHNRLRNIWVEAFSKPGLDRLRPKAQAIVDTLVASAMERLRSGEKVDLSSSICRPLPTIIIALLMGVPDEMHPDIVRWSDAMGAGGSAYLTADAAVVAHKAREDAKDALAAYLLDQMEYRRAHPGTDLVSLLVNADVAKGMPDEHLVQNLRQLLFAGNETTAKWLGSIFLNYAERGDVRRELVTDPSLIPAANDEVMRWAGVVGTLVRRVRGGPVDIGGVTLAEGDDLTLLLTSGNHDPARYENPDAFDIHRSPLPNLGFGVGLHNCLGSVLAKMEASMVVGRFLEEAPEFSIAGPYRYTTLPMRGPLPVTVALGG